MKERFLSKMNDQLVKDQMEAVRENPFSLTEMNNFPQEVALEAVRSSGKFIQLIRNPTELIQLAAIENDPSSIVYIWKPTLNVLDRAFKLDPDLETFFSEDWIETPTCWGEREPFGREFLEENQLYEVAEDPESIKFMYNPSRRVREAAFNRDPHTFKYYLDGMTFEELLSAIKVYPKITEYINGWVTPLCYEMEILGVCNVLEDIKKK